MGKIPSYRSRKGYDQALVTLTDSVSGKHRDYWLGPHGSRESRELYFRTIAEWEARGRRLPPVVDPAAGKNAAAYSGPTVTEIVREYWLHAKAEYSRSAAICVRTALRVLRELHGSTPASAFGPNALRQVRDAMVQGNANGAYPRPPWCRKTVNTRIGHIVRMYRWAASRELVGAELYHALRTLPALRRGKTAAVDHEPVGPVAIELVDAVRPFVSRQVAALIDLQLLTGARPGELVGLRAIDIDTKHDPWPTCTRPSPCTPLIPMILMPPRWVTFPRCTTSRKSGGSFHSEGRHYSTCSSPSGRRAISRHMPTT